VIDEAPSPDGRLVLSRLGLGTAPLAGMYGELGDDEAGSALTAARASGLRHVDTAPLYGYGLAERRVGAALAGVPRDEVVVSTKVGRLVEPAEHRAVDELFVGAPPGRAVPDYSADGVRRSLDASLERLGLDRVDLLLVHDPDEHVDQALRETFPALLRLRDEGVVTAVGAGMNAVAPLLRFVEEVDIDVVLVAGRLSLLDQEAAEALLPAAVRRGVGVIVGGVFNGGILAQPEALPMYDYRPAEDLIRERVGAIVRTCERHGVPLRAAALQAPLRYEGVTSVVVGARNGDEVHDAVAMLDVEVPDDLWAELEHERLVAEARP
jgi:D-threo-aldose 1-dehydrogenase